MEDMKLGQFLSEQVGINFRQLDLHALDELAGKGIEDVQFYTGIREAFGDAGEPYTPPFFYPIGYYHDWEIGLHLHPDYLGWESLIVAHNDHTTISDEAPMLADYVFRHLLRLEGNCYYQQKDPKDDRRLVEAVGVANSAFGAGFYQIGRFGEFSVDMLGYYEYKSSWCVSLEYNAKAALYHMGCGDTEAAAYDCSVALSKYRYTAGFLDLDKFYALCRTLLERHPETFTAETQRELTIDRSDKNALADWCTELYEAGNREWALKVLLDLCEQCSYDHPIAYRILVDLLGDTHAGRWVQHRQIKFDPASTENYEDWEQTLLKLLK